MSLIKLQNRLIFTHFTKQINRYLTTDNSIQPTSSPSSPQKADKPKQPTLLEKLSQQTKDTKEKPPRKGPFKYYFEDEERDRSKIVFYENFFDENTKQKNRENFMSAVEAFRLTNPTKQLYIDFIYGALLKMKEYNAHNHLEAYRKLMELFPIGPLISVTAWQRENLHFPRHQNCAMQILEQMERNGVMPDEEMGALVIKIFGDWTHAVRKVKRQLYWIPKFKNANPYSVPTIVELEEISDFDLAKFALERMCTSVDKETKITSFYTKDIEKYIEDTWILSAQSTKQKDLLKKHKREIPIFVEGPNYTWIRSKLVNYYVLKTDPLDETKKRQEQIKNYNEEDFKNVHNPFENPFEQANKTNKKPELSVHEQLDGIIYGVCCTGSNSKQSIIDWTNFLIKTNPSLENFIIVYRIKDKPGFLTTVLKEDKKQN